MAEELPASSNPPNIDINEAVEEYTLRAIRSLTLGITDPDVLSGIKMGCAVHLIDRLYMLHTAVQRPTIDVALELIKLGANVNARNADGYTPIFCARNHQRLDAMAMLLYYGADVHIPNLIETETLTCFSSAELELIVDYYHPDEVVELLGYTDFESPYQSSVSRFLTRAVEDGATINSFKYKCHPLSISIKEADLQLFKLIFSKIDMQRLPEFKEILFEEFLQTNKFQKSEWLKGLYLILKCSAIKKLFTYYFHYPSLSKRLFRALVDQCVKKKLEVTERRVLITFFLSFGLFVDEDTINFVHEYYGFNDELQAILYYGKFHHAEFKYIFTQYILADDPSREELNRYFSVALHSSFESVNKQQLLKMRKYFWSPIRFSSVDDEVTELHTVPSLVELSRNQARKYIQVYYNVKKPCQFYDVIKDLPKVYHDIICIKTSIYF